MGKAKEGGVLDVDNENTNFDFICVDEAHNFYSIIPCYFRKFGAVYKIFYRPIDSGFS